MLAIQEAIKKIIERFIAQIVPVSNAINSGTSTINVDSTRRFSVGDYIVIYEYNANDPDADNLESEALCITRIPDRNTLIVAEQLQQSYTANAAIQKLIGFQAGHVEYLRGIYLGDPAVITQFPSITIDGKSRNSEWLTLESTKERYEIDITVYVDGQAHYESQYQLMHYYIKQIERALFRSLYPLVEPFNTTTLSANVAEGDDVIRLTDHDFFKCGMGWIFLESIDHLLPNRIEESLGNGFFRLVRPVGETFSSGDTIIHPLRHLYNTLPHSTRYGTIVKNTILKAGVISYFAEECVNRFVKYIDPLTF